MVAKCCRRSRVVGPIARRGSNPAVLLCTAARGTECKFFAQEISNSRKGLRYRNRHYRALTRYRDQILLASPRIPAISRAGYCADAASRQPSTRNTWEVRGQRLGIKLSHHQCDLTPMVSGMVRQMLHQVRQTDLCRAKRKHFFQGFVCQAIHELGLFFFDFRPH